MEEGTNTSSDSADPSQNLPTFEDIEEESEKSSENSSSSDDVSDNIRIPLGSLEYSAEELMACEIAIKMSTNTTDAGFLRQINCIARGLVDKRHNLPRTRWKTEKQLKKLSKIKSKWAVYCPKCLDIVSETVDKPKTAYCKGPNCNNYCLKGDIANGRCTFMYLPIKAQIEGYLKNKNFRHVIQKFASMKGSHMGGKLHRGLIKAGHFDLSLGIDAAQLHNFAGKQILPAVLFFNNLPVSWQLRFPILAAVWTGSGKKHQPPRNVFLEKMQEELRRLGTVDEIVWTDNMGQRHRSSTFLTTILSDGPEKAELLNQMGCSGYYSCPFCFIKGTTLTKAKFPRIFASTNLFRRTTGSESVRGVRFPKLVHKASYRWRESKERTSLGIAAAQERIRSNDPDYHIKGIKGLPVVRNLPGTFEETDSHASDTLHLIAHGVFKDIMTVMVDGKPGLGNTFKQKTDGSYQIFDEMMDSMSKVSESDRNCRHLEDFHEWKAYDAFQFLLHDVALLCSNENIIKTTALYDTLVHLSNMVYLSHYGRMTSGIIQQHKSESKQFSKSFVDTLTEEYNTYKVHLSTSHSNDFLVNHGCAAYTDGFNLERFISVLKKLVTTNKVHMKQICRNFLIKHQCPRLQNMTNFCTAAKETLNENGFFSEEFFCKFEDVIKTRHRIQHFSKEIETHLKNFIGSELKMDPNTTSLIRVTQMIRKSVIFESEHTRHHKNTKIDDSFINLESGIFGKIADIAFIETSNQFIFVLKKFKKMTPRYRSSGASIPYPINQIPYEEDSIAQFHLFILTEDLFLQKAQTSTTNYFHEGRKVRIFSILPNEWFRY